MEISTRVAKGLQEIVSKARQVDQLVAEIATASQQQREGIEQVSKAIDQIGKVTQSNAASAQESASASGELNVQSDALTGAVTELTSLVGGKSGRSSHRNNRPEATDANPIADFEQDVRLAA